ncbi:YvrJ family protein [Peptoniphilus sp. GNH]|nr:YvrJ family protein [Peptoniphilus sp. GNH]
MDELLASIANIGFPIAVAAYLLVRIEQKLDNLSMSIKDLTNVLGKMEVK